MHTCETRTAFLWTRILSTPFYVLFTLLPYILYKDVGATLFQITTIIILKPAISLVAPYWSSSIYKRPDRLVANLFWANFLKFTPFLFIPWIDSIVYFTGASLIYLILGRGVIPAWMELLKQHIPGSSRTKVFAYGQALDYLGIALFPLTFGWLLDSFHESWRLLFFITALIGIASSFLLLRIPSKRLIRPSQPIKWSETLLKPWKQSWELVQRRPDFGRFQIGFMWGGAGLMILQPALPVFFTDTLHLSYQEMSFAIAFCKGVGYAATTPFWAQLFEKISIFKFSAIVTFLAALFPIMLIMAEYHMAFLWIAFFGYGIMQAGSELSWHLSGPTFSQEGDSSIFSQTNVLTQGIRGAITPFLGLCLCQLAGAPVTLSAGCLLCLQATQFMSRERLPIMKAGVKVTDALFSKFL